MNNINDKELVNSLFKVLIHQNVSKLNDFKQCSSLIDFAEFGDVTETDRWLTYPSWAKLTAAQLYNRALALSLVAYKIAVHDSSYAFYKVQVLRVNGLIQQIKDLERDILNFAKEGENEKDVLNRMDCYED